MVHYVTMQILFKRKGVRIRWRCRGRLQAGITREALKGNLKLFVNSLDSTRKMMSVIVRDREGKKFIVTKGAPDVLCN